MVAKEHNQSEKIIAQVNNIMFSVLQWLPLSYFPLLYFGAWIFNSCICGDRYSWNIFRKISPVNAAAYPSASLKKYAPMIFSIVMLYQKVTLWVWLDLSWISFKFSMFYIRYSCFMTEISIDKGVNLSLLFVRDVHYCL